MAMFVMKTLATAVACGVCIYACKLTNFWRGWVLLTIGLMTAPFIGVFQILGLLELPAPHTWDKLTGVYLPFVSMMFVSFGAWEVVRKIRIILRTWSN